jgi:LDH2 family malate/lactate/ureidoglycolate dehydrogenase
MQERYDADGLRKFAADMLAAAGLAGGYAHEVADTLVEADLLGYSTHGISFLPMYAKAIQAGDMASNGTIELLKESGPAVNFDGHMLPGPVGLRHTVAYMLDRVSSHPVQFGNVRHTHNTACLATYLLPVVERGLIGLVGTSSPANAAVAPPGGATGRYSTDPLAAGFPTDGDPVLIDMATSATTNRMNERLQRAGTEYSQPLLIDGDGRPSSDPTVLQADPSGAIMPLGGIESGHKGFALALIIETLSNALGGAGRAALKSTGKPQGSSSFVMILDPRAFAGDAFVGEMASLRQWLVDTPPAPGSEGVRLPGQRAMTQKRRQLAHGITLHPDVRAHVEPAARVLGLAFPEPLSE